MDRSTRRRRVFGALLLTAGFTATLAGCGNLTAGGIGEASVSMSGDAPDDPAPAPQPAIVSSTAPAGSDGASGGWTLAGSSLAGPMLAEEAEGQLEADLTVYLVSADGEPTAVTDGEVEVRLDLDGVEEPEIASRQVTATGYTALRMVFTDIEVEVDAGLVIGGQTVADTIDVEFEGMELVVEKPVAVEVREGQRVELLIDLNAQAWLQAVDPVTLTVDAQTFADLVTVRVR